MYLIRIGIWPTLGPPAWFLGPGGALSVGRNRACDLVLDDPAVSAFHLEIGFDNGRLQLTDLGSKNGTTLDGAAVTQAQPQPGQRVGVGGYTLRLGMVELAQASADELADMFARLLERADSPELPALARAWAQAAPREARAQAVLARALLAQGQVEAAQAAAERAAWLDPTGREACLARALVAERRGLLAEASELIEQILADHPDDQAAKQARQRLGRKAEVLGKIQALVPVQGDSAPLAPDQEAVLEGGAFRLRAERGVDLPLVLTAYAVLAQLAERFQQHLGTTPDRVEVHIHPKAPNGDSVWQQAAAVYDGAIHLNAAKLASPDPSHFYVALAHEYLHLVVDRLSQGRAPAWLSEGLAQYLTQNLTHRDREVLRLAVTEQALLPFEVLDQDFARLPHKKIISLAYAQSFSMVEFLVQEWGWDWLRSLLGRMGGGPGWRAALAELDVDLPDLEKRWIAWLA